MGVVAKRRLHMPINYGICKNPMKFAPHALDLHNTSKRYQSAVFFICQTIKYYFRVYKKYDWKYFVGMVKLVYSSNESKKRSFAWNCFHLVRQRGTSIMYYKELNPKRYPTHVCVIVCPTSSDVITARVFEKYASMPPGQTGSWARLKQPQGMRRINNINGKATKRWLCISHTLHTYTYRYICVYIYIYMSW